MMTDRGIRLADPKPAAMPVRLSVSASSHSIGRSWRRGRTVANETVFRNGRCVFLVERIQITHHQSKSVAFVCVCASEGPKNKSSIIILLFSRHTFFADKRRPGNYKWEWKSYEKRGAITLFSLFYHFSIQFIIRGSFLVIRNPPPALSSPKRRAMSKTPHVYMIFPSQRAGR